MRLPGGFNLLILSLLIAGCSKPIPQPSINENYDTVIRKLAEVEVGVSIFRYNNFGQLSKDLRTEVQLHPMPDRESLKMANSIVVTLEFYAEAWKAGPDTTSELIKSTNANIIDATRQLRKRLDDYVKITLPPPPGQ